MLLVKCAAAVSTGLHTDRIPHFQFHQNSFTTCLIIHSVIQFNGKHAKSFGTHLQGTLGHDDEVAVDDHSHPHFQQLPDRLQQHVFTEPQEDEARQDVAHAEQADPRRPGY